MEDNKNKIEKVNSKSGFWLSRLFNSNTNKESSKYSQSDMKISTQPGIQSNPKRICVETTRDKVYSIAHCDESPVHDTIPPHTNTSLSDGIHSSRSSCLDSQPTAFSSSLWQGDQPSALDTVFVQQSTVKVDAASYAVNAYSPVSSDGERYSIDRDIESPDSQLYKQNALLLMRSLSLQEDSSTELKCPEYNQNMQELDSIKGHRLATSELLVTQEVCDQQEIQNNDNDISQDAQVLHELHQSHRSCQPLGSVQEVSQDGDTLGNHLLQYSCDHEVSTDSLAHGDLPTGDFAHGLSVGCQQMEPSQDLVIGNVSTQFNASYNKTNNVDIDKGQMNIIGSEQQYVPENDSGSEVDFGTQFSRDVEFTQQPEKQVNSTMSQCTNIMSNALEEGNVSDSQQNSRFVDLDATVLAQGSSDDVIDSTSELNVIESHENEMEQKNVKASEDSQCELDIKAQCEQHATDSSMDASHQLSGEDVTENTQPTCAQSVNLLQQGTKYDVMPGTATSIASSDDVLLAALDRLMNQLHQSSHQLRETLQTPEPGERQDELLNRQGELLSSHVEIAAGNLQPNEQNDNESACQSQQVSVGDDSKANEYLNGSLQVRLQSNDRAADDSAAGLHGSYEKTTDSSPLLGQASQAHPLKADASPTLLSATSNLSVALQVPSEIAWDSGDINGRGDHGPPQQDSVSAQLLDSNSSLDVAHVLNTIPNDIIQTAREMQEDTCASSVTGSNIQVTPIAAVAGVSSPGIHAPNPVHSAALDTILSSASTLDLSEAIRDYGDTSELDGTKHIDEHLHDMDLTLPKPHGKRAMSALAPAHYTKHASASTQPNNLSSKQLEQQSQSAKKAQGGSRLPPRPRSQSAVRMRESLYNTTPSPLPREQPIIRAGMRPSRLPTAPTRLAQTARASTSHDTRRNRYDAYARATPSKIRPPSRSGTASVLQRRLEKQRGRERLDGSGLGPHYGDGYGSRGSTPAYDDYDRRISSEGFIGDAMHGGYQFNNTHHGEHNSYDDVKHVDVRRSSSGTRPYGRTPAHTGHRARSQSSAASNTITDRVMYDSHRHTESQYQVGYGRQRTPNVHRTRPPLSNKPQRPQSALQPERRIQSSSARNGPRQGVSGIPQRPVGDEEQWGSSVVRQHGSLSNSIRQIQTARQPRANDTWDYAQQTHVHLAPQTERGGGQYRDRLEKRYDNGKGSYGARGSSRYSYYDDCLKTEQVLGTEWCDDQFHDLGRGPPNAPRYCQPTQSSKGRAISVHQTTYVPTRLDALGRKTPSWSGPGDRLHYSDAHNQSVLSSQNNRKTGILSLLSRKNRREAGSGQSVSGSSNSGTSSRSTGKVLVPPVALDKVGLGSAGPDKRVSSKQKLKDGLRKLTPRRSLGSQGLGEGPARGAQQGPLSARTVRDDYRDYELDDRRTQSGVTGVDVPFDSVGEGQPGVGDSGGQAGCSVECLPPQVQHAVQQYAVNFAQMLSSSEGSVPGNVNQEQYKQLLQQHLYNSLHGVMEQVAGKLQSSRHEGVNVTEHGWQWQSGVADGSSGDQMWRIPEHDTAS